MTPRQRIRRIQRWLTKSEGLPFAELMFSMRNWETTPPHKYDRFMQRLGDANELIVAELDWLTRYALIQQSRIESTKTQLDLMLKRINSALDVVS